LLDSSSVLGPRNSCTSRQIPQLFFDRSEAGRTLAMSLMGYRTEGPITVGVEGGGVVVAAEVSRALDTPLELWGPEGPRGGRVRRRLGGAAVIVVDEGVETGATARAVLRSVRADRPRHVVLAVPVGSASAIQALEHEADAIICLIRTEAVCYTAAWYQQFDPVHQPQIEAIIGERAGSRFRRPA
jgi:predicted phosphoribosyltransferase